MDTPLRLTEDTYAKYCATVGILESLPLSDAEKELAEIILLHDIIGVHHITVRHIITTYRIAAPEPALHRLHAAEIIIRQLPRNKTIPTLYSFNLEAEAIKGIWLDSPRNPTEGQLTAL